MPAPSISPTTPGATTYTIRDSGAVVADLRLFIPATGPGALFRVTFPSDRAGVQVTLGRGTTSLDLIPPVDSDLPQPTFAHRHVISTFDSRGASAVLRCEIRALAEGGVKEPWRVRVTGLGGSACVFEQLDNDPADLTVPRIACDPAADFTIGGEVTATAAGATVSAKGAVRLRAGDAIGPATVVAGQGVPRPTAYYRWTASGGPAVGRLPACGPDPAVSFFAPATSTPQDVRLTLETWFDSPCADGPGPLHSAATKSLTVTPLAGEFVVGPPLPLSQGAWLDIDAHLTLDDSSGLVVVWASGRGAPVGGLSLYASRLDLLDVASGFSNPPLALPPQTYESAPWVGLLPGGELIVSYRENLKRRGEVWFRRARFADLATATGERVTPPATAESWVVDHQLVVSGDHVVFLYMMPSAAAHTRPLLYRRYRHTDRTWLDAAPGVVSQGPVSQFHAARDPSGKVWVAFAVSGGTDSNTVQVARLDLGTGTLDQAGALTPALPHSAAGRLFALCTAGGAVWIFWTEPQGFRFRLFRGGAWFDAQTVPGTATASGSMEFKMVADSSERLWLFWTRPDAPGGLFVTWRDPLTGSWAPPSQVSAQGTIEDAVITPENTIWIIWSVGVQQQPIINYSAQRITLAL
jgi:hypothetical protein